MLVILYLEAENFFRKLISQRDDHFFSGDVSTVYLIEQNKASELVNYLIKNYETNTQKKVLFNSRENSSTFELTYKIITVNLEPIIDLFNLKKNISKLNCGIDLFRLIQNEIDFDIAEKCIQKLTKLKTAETECYINFLLYELDILKLDYNSEDLEILKTDINNFWVQLNLKSLNLGVLGTVISSYLKCSEFVEVQNLNNEKMKVYSYPQIGDFTYIESGYLNFIFDPVSQNNIFYRRHFLDGGGVFLDHKWNKYQEYLSHWKHMETAIIKPHYPAINIKLV